MVKVNLSKELAEAKKILEESGVYLSLGEKMILRRIGLPIVNSKQQAIDFLIEHDVAQSRNSINPTYEIAAQYLFSRIGIQDTKFIAREIIYNAELVPKQFRTITY